MLHLSCSILALGIATGFQLARGQHGAMPYSTLEIAANVVGTVLMAPAALPVRLFFDRNSGALLLAVLLNSVLCGWALALLWRRIKLPN
jgi:hypothetical protein